MASSSIPLNCNICPKKPTFSDVSHLLTHIASKGHLSNYYRVKVRSGGEEASRRLIEDYDRWYVEWNVEDLMSERMNLKEKRRTRTRAGASSRAGAPRAPMSSHGPRKRVPVANVLDPRLSEHPVKLEVHPTPPPVVDRASLHRSFVPRMGSWPSSATPSTFYGTPDAELDEYSDGPDYFDGKGTYRDLCVVPSDPPQDGSEDLSIPECTKLKGVFWPGMDIFDSATPEMRRKRNQKKHVSVLEQLEQNSQDVEPTELVFTPLGSLKKQRRISSSGFEDSSPIKPEPSPKRSRRQGRSVLAELDFNQPRGRRVGTRQEGRAPLKSLCDDEDERVELQMTYDDLVAPKKKRLFEVFQDQEVSFAHPAGFNYLTSEFHCPQPSPPPAFDMRDYPNPFQFDTKENGLEPFPRFHPPTYPLAPEFNYPQPYHQNGFPLPPHPSYGQLQMPEPQLLFTNPFFFNQPPHEDGADDQRTVSAPPSEREEQ